MARKIKMSFSDEHEFYFTLKKFTKGDLYGIKTKEKRLDNKLLKTVSISSDGSHILPKGSTSLQFLDADGKYIERNDVEIFSKEGEKIELTPSMFGTGVNLEEITFSDYFRYNFVTSYYLNIENDAQYDLLYLKCTDYFENEKLFKFKYTFRETTHPQEAVLIPKDEKIIVLVGTYAPEIYNTPVLNIQEFSEINDEDEIKFEDIW